MPRRSRAETVVACSLAVLAIFILVLARAFHPGARVAATVSGGGSATVSGGGRPSSCPSVPGPAAAVGYCDNTFSITNFTKSNVDTAGSNAPGFMLYLQNWFGNASNPVANTINADGSITNAGQASGGGTLVSGAVITSSPYFRGMLFGGGGYFCATFKLSSTEINNANGWPSYYLFSGNHIRSFHGGNALDQWTGTAGGYEHFPEIDVIEYFGSSYGNNRTLHDWHGVFNATCVGHSYCNDQSDAAYPMGVNSFTHYHNYCELWVPATASTNGFVKDYYDGAQQGSALTWTQYTGGESQPPPPSDQPWLYGILDRDWMDIAIGGSSDSSTQILSIQVWQASGANNLRN